MCEFYGNTLVGVKQQHGGRIEIRALGEWSLGVWFLQRQYEGVSWTIHLVLLRLGMSGATPPFLHLLSWRAQGQLCKFLYIFRYTAWPDFLWNSSGYTQCLTCCQFLHEIIWLCYCSYQVFEPCHIFRGIIGCLCIMIISSVLVIRCVYMHRHDWQGVGSEVNAPPIFFPTMYVCFGSWVEEWQIKKCRYSLDDNLSAIKIFYLPTDAQ